MKALKIALLIFIRIAAVFAVIGLIAFLVWGVLYLALY